MIFGLSVMLELPAGQYDNVTSKPPYDFDMCIYTFSRMLGYEDVLCAVTGARFGAAESSVPILMDNMLCRGNEAALDHCDFNGWGNHGCTHREDAGVVCEDSKHACQHTRIRSHRLFSVPIA
jgi:hypothetical protein